MSMRPWLGIAVLAAAALPWAAAAQSAFDKRIAHWRISAGGASCLAFNRPAYELNASPFNALSVQLNKQGRWNFMVHFWPKTFTPDADIPLVFSFGGAKDVKALGKAASEYLVILSNIGASFRDDVAKAPKGEMRSAPRAWRESFTSTSPTPPRFSRRSRTARRPCASANMPGGSANRGPTSYHPPPSPGGAPCSPLRAT